MLDLKDNVAVVTGGGTAIGREIALELARAGAAVTVVGRRLLPLEETVVLAAAEGKRCRVLELDVTDPAAVKAGLESIVTEHGGIDILVNNAGRFGAIGALWEVEADEWWQDVVTNLKGPMLCIKAVLPSMLARSSGIIINIDGGGGADGANRGGSAYGSSKAALARLTETLARELATIGSGVQTYGMFPGLVRSAMTESLITSPERRRWQQFVADRFEHDGDRPARDCALAIASLIAIAGPDLSGRSFTVDDDFTEIDRRRAEIAKDELRIMRLRPLPEEKP